MLKPSVERNSELWENTRSFDTKVKELKTWLRNRADYHLQPGEEQTISFTLTPQDLGLWDKNNQFTVEPGSFSIMIGADSEVSKL